MNSGKEIQKKALKKEFQNQLGRNKSRVGKREKKTQTMNLYF